MFCKSCGHEIVFVLICTLAEQFHDHKSYNTWESTLSCIGNFEENIDMSHIYLAVLKCKKKYLITRKPLPFFYSYIFSKFEISKGEK